MIITVGGQAASGKTTLAKALAQRLGFKHVSAGRVMREMAAEKGMPLTDFSKYAEAHPEVDREIDERQKLHAKGDCVVDGRLSRYFLSPDLSIWLVAPVEVRGARALKRGETYGSVDDAAKDASARDDSERRRYMDFYDIDISDLSVYDVVINTGKFGVEEMTSLALAAAKALKR
jgi:CMP/dCMP kinase